MDQKWSFRITQQDTPSAKVERVIRVPISMSGLQKTHEPVQFQGLNLTTHLKDK